MTTIHPRTTAAQDHWADLPRPGRGLRTRVSAYAARLLFEAVVGSLPITVRLHEADGIDTLGLGGPVMDVYRPEELFERLGRDANVGFGEAYLTGAWDSVELAAVLTPLAARLGTLVPKWLQLVRRAVITRTPDRERGAQQDARRNIAHHYDLSNDLFAAFLDDTMSYSCARFRTDQAGRPILDDDLIEAQQRKIDSILDLAGVGQGTRLLEIGTGWGELAMRAAARGATVHSITLSEEQLELARERISHAGYAGQVELELCDYRQVSGEYDAVVSVEMIEAVGWRYWDAYFASIDRVLAPEGRVALQAITMPHAQMLATRDSYSWMTKYIFPGGFLPSREALEESAGRAAGLELRSLTSLGLHYAETLRQWDVRFREHGAEIAALGFDADFQRMWHYYLEYCRAGFVAGYIDDVQMVFTRGYSR